MAHCNKLLCFFLLLVLYSCQPEAASPPPLYMANAESPCLGLWQYEKVLIKNKEYFLANAEMIPGEIKSSLGGNRAELERRRRYYGDDGYYQLRWVDRGEYRLGDRGDSDWQPSVGSWRWIAGSDSIIHNENQYYQQKYHILATANQLVLTSLRKMSSNDPESNVWRAGETVLYQEHFIRVVE